MDRADGTVEWAAIAHRKGRAVRGGGRATQHTAIVCDRPPRNCRTVAIQLSTYNDTLSVVHGLLVLSSQSCMQAIMHHARHASSYQLTFTVQLLSLSCELLSPNLTLSRLWRGERAEREARTKRYSRIANAITGMAYRESYTGTGLGHRQRLAVSSVCGPCLGLR